MSSRTRRRKRATWAKTIFAATIWPNNFSKICGTLTTFDMFLDHPVKSLKAKLTWSGEKEVNLGDHILLATIPCIRGELRMRIATLPRCVISGSLVPRPSIFSCNYTRGLCLLTLGAHAQRGLEYLVCHSVRSSVRLSVITFSATTRSKATKKRYQRVQCHTGLILKMAIFVKLLRSKVMAWKPSQQANMLMSMAYLDQILPVSSTVVAVEVTRRVSM